MLKPPANNAPPEQYRLMQWLVDSVQELNRSLGLSSESGDNNTRQLNSSVGLLAEQVAALQAQQEATAELVARLSETADAQYASSSAWHSGAGWHPTPPSVISKSSSGRFRVTVGGGASGGMAIFTFSAPSYDRTRALGGGAAAIENNVTAFGGASVSGSASKSWIATLEPGVSHTFSAEANNTDEYTSSTGLFIMVEPLL